MFIAALFAVAKTGSNKDALQLGNKQTGTSIQWDIHARTWMNLRAFC